ncbi:metallophosphoesterase [Halonotius terrestris]|uniref:Phosphoesterase n=1 Tax=Halonotius terrestris TaxID=2487750 RepID=A0A8J8PC07_9EURY|nr:metallophosphoesterase [Halonotius terrestris]TQQ81318.1 metallophosphoesterase [Halonotius terrestris]
MHIGIVSDTHDNLDHVQQAVSLFEAEGVDHVIHCGDIIAPFSATPFDSDSFDFVAVRGNNDGEWALSNVVDDFGSYLGESGDLTLDGVDIAVYHGTSEQLREGLADSGDYDYVFHGHTHERTVDTHGDAVRVNPGGLPIPGADNAFHVATLDTELSGEDAITHHELG